MGKRDSFFRQGCQNCISHVERKFHSNIGFCKDKVCSHCRTLSLNFWPYGKKSWYGCHNCNLQLQRNFLWKAFFVQTVTSICFRTLSKKFSDFSELFLARLWELPSTSLHEYFWALKREGVYAELANSGEKKPTYRGKFSFRKTLRRKKVQKHLRVEILVTISFEKQKRLSEPVQLRRSCLRGVDPKSFQYQAWWMRLWD